MYAILSTILHCLLITVILLSSNIARSHCKRFLGKNDDKIIGGEIAEPESSPWLASIQDLNFDFPIHFCGASIINNFFLITAAYCVAQYSVPYDKLKVVVGEFDLAHEDGWEVDLTIKNVIINPDYDPDYFRYDVAIIEVNEEIIFTKRVQPIHLPHPHGVTTYKHKDMAKIYGWGKTKLNENPVDLKRMATIPLISFEECQHTAYGDIITPPTMCAGDLEHGGVGSCIGDWGGPLVILSSGKNIDGNVNNSNDLDEPVYVLIGVTSLSIGCGEPDIPNFYVDVREILEWIHENTSAQRRRDSSTRQHLRKSATSTNLHSKLKKAPSDHRLRILITSIITFH